MNSFRLLRRVEIPADELAASEVAYRWVELAEGAEFSDGTVALRWRSSVSFFGGMDAVMSVHVRDDRTRIEWDE